MNGSPAPEGRLELIEVVLVKFGPAVHIRVLMVRMKKTVTFVLFNKRGKTKIPVLGMVTNEICTFGSLYHGSNDRLVRSDFRKGFSFMYEREYIVHSHHQAIGPVVPISRSKYDLGSP